MRRQRPKPRKPGPVRNTSRKTSVVKKNVKKNANSAKWERIPGTNGAKRKTKTLTKTLNKTLNKKTNAVQQKLPLSGSEPVFSDCLYSNRVEKNSNNCYAYSRSILDHHMFTKLQPGNLSGGGGAGGGGGGTAWA